VIVELDIFSGMPNPTWALSPSAGSAFLARLAALPPAAEYSFPGNLGYRGFVVEIAPGSTARLQNGVVRRSVGDSVNYLADPGRSLERFLLDSGRSVLSPEVLATVSRHLPPPDHHPR
jgi:hypothetical protein